MKKIIALMIILLMINTATATIHLGSEPTTTGQAPPPSAEAPTAGQNYYVATKQTTVEGQTVKAGQAFTSDKPVTAAYTQQIPQSTFNYLNNNPHNYDTNKQTFTVSKPWTEDNGVLEDFKTRETTTITINTDGTTRTIERETQTRTGVVRGENDWRPAQREKETTNYNKDGTINNIQTPVYPVTRDLLGNREYAQTPAYVKQTTYFGPAGQQRVSSVTLRDANGVPYYRVNGDGTTADRAQLATEARTNARIYGTTADTAYANYWGAEGRVNTANQRLAEAQSNYEKTEGANAPVLQAAYDELIAAQSEAKKAKAESDKADDQYSEAKAKATAAEKEAGDLEAAKGQENTPEQEQGKTDAKHTVAQNTASVETMQNLRGFWGKFGLFMKAYDEYSGLRQYSALGMNTYDTQAQRRKAKIQSEFCLNVGIENCVTSLYCGSIHDISADNVIAGTGPVGGPFVSSGIINAERSIPIELEGMTRQQLIDLFGNTTVISGRRINLTDPSFDPKILGRIKIWQYHVQYTLTNNAQVAGKTMRYNLNFNKAEPGSATSYGIPVKESKWYPSDQTLDPGMTATDQNLIWKYSATEYTDACLNFDPPLPSKNKLVHHICAPFIEYQGGPTEVGGKEGELITETGKEAAQQPGTFI